MVNETENIIELFDEFYFIEEPLIKRVKESENPIKINFEGGNNQHLVFIYEGEFSVQDKDMLHKLIHNAMKFTMEDIALISLANNIDMKPDEMINIMKPKHIIIWGAEQWTKQYMAKLNLYEPSSELNANWLRVDAVERFHDNVPLKTALWSGIQSLLKK